HVLRQRDRRRTVPELLFDDGYRRWIRQLAAEQDDVGLLTLDRGADVVERRDDVRLDPLLLEARVDPNGRLDVLQRDENLHCRGGEPWSSGAPRITATAWSTIGSSAASPSVTPPVEPGRLTMSVFLRVPLSPRLNADRGNDAIVITRIRSAIPGASRSSTARVASGVTSRSLSPVPPVVITRSAASRSHHATRELMMSDVSSGTRARSATL